MIFFSIKKEEAFYPYRSSLQTAIVESSSLGICRRELVHSDHRWSIQHLTISKSQASLKKLQQTVIHFPSKAPVSHLFPSNVFSRLKNFLRTFKIRNTVHSYQPPLKPIKKVRFHNRPTSNFWLGFSHYNPSLSQSG